MLTALLLSLGDTSLATALRQSSLAYPLVNAVHIAGLGLLIGSVVTLDLRLLGVIRRGTLSDLAPLMSRLAAAGLLLAIITGIALFSVQPPHYLGNHAFLLKLALIGLGLLNVLVVHQLPAWHALLAGQAATLTLKLTACLSLALWLAVLLAGRWIAFV